MSFQLHHNRDTDVAYVDICPLPQVGAVNVDDISELVGFKTQVLARVGEDGTLLGLIIEDYTSFKRELRLKYLSLAVERLLDLIVSKVRFLMTPQAPCSQTRRLTAHPQMALPLH